MLLTSHVNLDLTAQFTISGKMADFILGIDIGGTNIKVGIFSISKNRIIEKSYEKTENNLEKFLNTVSKIVNKFKKKYKIEKVGIGFPGNINEIGEIIFSPHVSDAIGFNIVNFFERELNVSLKIDNDANLSALAHLKFSKEKISDLICLTLGTGIGGGVVLKKELLNSSRGIGFELGHITVLPDGEKCSCGKNGCMEAYSSASGMIKRYGDNNLKEFIELYNLYKNGDEKAKKIIDEGFFYLGIGTGSLVNIFAPEKVFFAGGISEVFYEFYDSFLNGVKKSCLKFLFEKVKFEKSNLKDSGILGAVSLWI